MFITSVLLGGQQRTVKFSGAMKSETNKQKQDAVRAALGAKIVAPYVSASFQYSRRRGTGSSAKDQDYADLSYLGMSASGGDTLIGAEYVSLAPSLTLPTNVGCISIPSWTKSVAAPENWRVIGVGTSRTRCSGRISGCEPKTWTD